jgi:hypothetical protein
MLSPAAGQGVPEDLRFMISLSILRLVCSVLTSTESDAAVASIAGAVSTLCSPDDDAAEADASLCRVLTLSAPCTDVWPAARTSAHATGRPISQTSSDVFREASVCSARRSCGPRQAKPQRPAS